MIRSLTAALVGFGFVFLAGCGDKPTPQDEFKNKQDEHDHSRGKEMLEDATLPGGKKCHAALTAHIAKDGDHALEVSFETMDKEPKPLTLPEKTKLTLRVQRGEEVFSLTLEPGPKKERKTDPDGQCSRFEVEAKWLKPEGKLTATLTIEGAPEKVVWIDFDVKKYSHAGD